MEIRMLNQDSEKATFIIEGVNAGFVNALRRAFISEIPTFAVDYVIFYSNTSPLYDEIIAHRLAMVPLTTETNRYIPAEECCEEGCEKCSVTLSISKDGPGMVMSGDMVSEDSDVVPAFDNIPLVKLGTNQKLVLNAIARIGYAKDHVKYQSSIASYQHVAEITVDEEVCDLGGACIRACPRDVLAIMEDELVPKHLYSCNLCRTCVDICDFDAIAVEPVKGSFIFKLESFGSIPLKKLVEEVVKVFTKKADELMEQLESL